MINMGTIEKSTEKSTRYILPIHTPSTTEKINEIFDGAFLISLHSVPWYDQRFISEEAKIGMVRRVRFTAKGNIHAYRKRNNMELIDYHDFISHDFHRGTYLFRNDDWPNVADYMASVIKVPIAGDSAFEKSNYTTVQNILTRAGFTIKEANEIMHIKEMKETHSSAPAEILRKENMRDETNGNFNNINTLQRD